MGLTARSRLFEARFILNRGLSQNRKQAYIFTEQQI